VSHAKHGKLIELLLKKTIDNTLEWKTSVLEERYQISFRDNTVRLYKTEHGEYGNPVIYLELINDEGVVAETVNDEELDHDIPKGEHFWYKKLAMLFELSRRSALGSDKILNEILADLDDDVPF
jgi:hypothetical protein